MNKKYVVVRNEETEQVSTYNDLINAASEAIAAAHDSDYKLDIYLRSWTEEQDLAEIETVCLCIDNLEVAAR